MRSLEEMKERRAELRSWLNVDNSYAIPMLTRIMWLGEIMELTDEIGDGPELDRVE